MGDLVSNVSGQTGATEESMQAQIANMQREMLRMQAELNAKHG